MNIFLKRDYQLILKELVQERKQLDSRVNFQAMAKATRIPKSYLSKVTGGHAHLSFDQIYLVCEYLQLSEVQTSYMQLLVDYARTGLQRRKNKLLREIQKMQTQSLETKQHLEAGSASLTEQGLKDYYLDPLNQVVHIALSIPRYQKSPGSLADVLHLPKSEIVSIIQRLESLGIIERRKSINTVIKNIHLPRQSPVYKPWRNQVKLLCLERLNRFQLEGDYSFSVTFSADTDTKNRMRGEFLELLKRSEKWVGDSNKEEAYQMNFDLFSWTAKQG